MQAYELIIIFLVGAALGIIARYILGYRKRHAAYVAVNLVFGGAACLFCHLLWGSNTYAIFLSGTGGVVFSFLYSIIELVI